MLWVIFVISTPRLSRRKSEYAAAADDGRGRQAIEETRAISRNAMRNTLIGLALTLILASCAPLAQEPGTPAGSDPLLASFYTSGGGGGGKVQTTFVQSIAVSSPAYCSQIKGDVSVTFTAPGMTMARAYCWQQPTAGNPSPWGHDVNLAPELKLDADGKASFIFHGDQFPNGPVTVRIYAKDGGKNQDYCELQLFNRGGVAWNQGIPKTDPPAAKGMKLAFADDFDGPLSIAKDNSGRYWTHWGGGDGSVWPFGENEGTHNPFSQVKGEVKNFLRIHGSKPAGTNGIAGSLATVHRDGTGIAVKAPCYFECRFIAQNATGAWPAFWITTNGGVGCDEMDAIEAYGTNSKTGGVWTAYHVTSHFWGQPNPAWMKEKGPDGNPYNAHAMVETMAVGGKSSWSSTFHTYGLLITPTETAYYFDNIEVLRHPSGKNAASQAMGFLLNLAIGGGGWIPDLQRYGDQSDMWVDYVRLYQGD
jgi:hypothetical protein